MPEFVYANLSCILNLDCASAPPPRPFCASAAAYLALHLAAPVAVVVVVWWLWRNLLLLPLPLPLEGFAGGGDGRRLLDQQPPRTHTLVDADGVAVAAAAARGFFQQEAPTRPILLRRRAPHAGADGYFRYPQIRYLEAVPQVRLIDAEFMEEMTRGARHGVGMLRQAAIHYHDPIRRLSNLDGNPSVFQGDPCVLATESTDIVIKLKVATALVCFIWRELNGHSQQLCQEVKEECFSLVAGQSVEKLLEVAHSFSEASWCACHVKEVMTTVDALIDVLYNLQGLPLNRSGEIAVISCKMVINLGGVLDQAASSIDNSEESTIHPATVVFNQVLEFFDSNTDMVHLILATGDCTVDPYSHVFDCWVSKLEEDAKKMCQAEKDREYIILLNNACDVWQMMRRPGAPFSNVELMSRLTCMIQIYRRGYFEECWVPLVQSLLEEDYLKNPRRSSLAEFTQGFVSICDRQMTWKVVPSLKYELRDEIKNLVVTPYKALLHALQENRRGLSLKRLMSRKRSQNEYTAEQLENKIGEFFES
ncbi:hypothetical protein CFC21_020914 [Triticum aestivum]|uniref:Exocyst subunit Exo70 family protein n=2 Tax=Triticum aestivum TaxID=4565 RepID=A0A9R1J696_WHEAT|nr:uncharacterized protein LOC119366864 [Triticum dicoccoides]XP_044318947.1 uncharacterized protein LOC123040071 [Triticum aestivum]KAF7005815.1 hypothetical protein CFC21_020914 [Triticum aestivum]